MPPFIVPPTQRDGKRMWIGIGIGVVMVLLCCVGGLIGIGVLLAGSAQQMESQAVDVVDEYLNALQEEKYSVAYGLLCEDLADKQSLHSFSQKAKEDPIVSYSIHSGVSTDEDTADLIVGATVVSETQGSSVRQYVVTGTVGAMTICGER